MLVAPTTPKIVGPQDGKAGWLGSIGARLIIPGADTEDGFSLVEHPMPPRALAAPRSEAQLQPQKRHEGDHRVVTMIRM